MDFLDSTERIVTDSLVAPEKKLLYNIRTKVFSTDVETGVLTVSRDDDVISTSSLAEYAMESKIIDWVVPSFSKRRNKGEIFNNPFNSVKEVRTTSAAECGWNCYQKVLTEVDEVVTKVYEATYTNYGERPASRWLSHSTLPFHTFESELSLTRDLAVTQARANVELSGLSVLATIGELKETVLGLRDIYKRVGRIFSALKFDISTRSKLGSLNQRILKQELSLKELKNRYMEARYAIRPLVYDVIRYLESIGKRLQKNTRHTFRASESCDKADQATRSLRFGTYELDVLYMSKYSCIARAGLLCDVEEVTLSNFLGMDQILETAWELTPLSFVADWFFNIGSMLAAWTPETGVRTLASWVSVTEEISSSATVIGVRHDAPKPPNVFQNLTLNNCQITKNITRKVRTPDPFPCIFPRFKVKLDALKLLDLALIWGQITRYR
jgi:hypothetical protein